MYKILVLTLALVAVATAYVIEDQNGEEYLLVPLHRQRRQTIYDISKGNGGGVRATIGHKGTIYNNGVHRVDGAGIASKQFKPSGPLTVGGQLEYSHIPSGSSLNLGAQRTQKFGTDFSASGKANIWKNKNTRLDAVATYDRHYGGYGGTGKPNYYGGIQFTHKF